MGKPLWLENLQVKSRAWRRQRQWAHQRVSIAQPVYRPGYVPGITWWQVALIVCGIAIVALLATLYARENYWRYRYRNNPTFVTTYHTPRSTPANKDSHYVTDCSDKSTIQGLSNCVGFTDEGRKLLDKTKPAFAGEADVAKDCNVGQLAEGEAIFGCWTFINGDERISMLGANDPLYAQFKESPEVTLAHEFLHAVYYRLSVSDQQQIFTALSSEYGNMVNEIVALGYDYSQVDDELFTRVGSEQTKAPAMVKRIYAKYLTKWSNKSTSDSSNKGNNNNDPSNNSTDTTQSVPASTNIPTDNQPTQTAAPADHTNTDYAKLQRCTVGRVSDGDTLYVDCLPQRIRLIGVDTPESTKKHQCYGNESSNHTKSLVGQTVYLESDGASGDTDMYGRYLRYVYLADGTNYNMQLVEDGYGMLYIFSGQQFKYISQFSSAQDTARGAGKGLWSACQTGINKYGNYQVTN